ncbi:MAG: hypothetical protein HYU80_02500 [Candidatus Blackburnbacteria bacterium]|nr:hypothetical protein [Candidatus Blackburnbacteria bacterium]
MAGNVQGLCLSRRRLGLLAIVGSPIFVGACAWGDSPEKAAKEWLSAIFNSSLAVDKKVGERTCRSQQETVLSIVKVGTSGLVERYTGGRVKVAQVTTVSVGIYSFFFETLAVVGDVAEVRARGTFGFTTRSSSQTIEVDEVWRMIREGGIWKWCGLASSASKLR